MPSVADLVFIALLAGLSLGALGRLLLRDADIGWHIRNGQQMLLAHAIPRTDSFSSTMSGHPWYAWEWLYDLLVAVIHQALGWNGVVFYSAAIIAATFVLMLHLSMRRGGSLPVTLFLLVLSMAASAVHFLARPHIVSWLFTVIWFDLLDSALRSSGRERTRRLLCLPALMLFWVNLHGGFLLGFVLVGIHFAGAAIEYVNASEPASKTQITSWLKSLTGTTVTLLLVSLVNPYGYQLHLHIYRYLSDRFLIDRISEFLSPNFHGVAQQCFAVLLLITMVALASARRKLRPTELLVILLAAYSGLYATRNLPVSALLLTLIIAPLLSEAMAAAGANPEIASWLRRFFARLQAFGSRMESVELNFRSHLWLVLVFVLGMWACAHGGKLGSTPFINAYFDDKRFPVEATEVIAQRGIQEPVFSLDYWGGYLIYRLYPETKVVVDDRHDLYGAEFFKDYLKVVFAQPGWEKVLSDQRIDWVLVPTDSSLASMLRLTPEWKTVHEDGTAVLFHRESF